MTRLRKFLLLSPSDKRLYLTVIFCLLAIRVALFFVPFGRLRLWLMPCAGTAPGPTDVGDLHRITIAIERSGRLLACVGTNCLPQALVGQWLLQRRGFEVELKIGVCKCGSGVLLAHAWLVHRGKVVLGGLDALPQFTAFPRLGRLPR